ncbi:epimerase [Rothia sp. HMSC078H08]|uniref:NAD-dependent epimerase/dehydratase family protein n=1 Tax=Rothia sp. HMSC078H08 TaxID=1715008 RepID=UPI0008A200DA|nr:NAD-dependent epimerase/dehydratase family protein [Rothia sp. HMSC078H08]OFN72234.1 epimerase [Rothia sp. HMSC078H08]
MSESRWKVIGASGFVGSAIVARLNAEGISVDPIEAPRLATRSLDVDSIIDEAEQLEGIIDSLAEAFASAQVVVNAAGLAAPNMQDLPPLMGANALLPAVIAIAAQRTGVRRVIHLSSAAVQGPRLVLDSSEETAPFSAYSFSKTLGEEALLDLQDYFLEEHPESAPELCILRATSVQGRGRRTTELFAKMASSPFASVAGAGQGKSPVSSVYALAEFVVMLGTFPGELPTIVLQPWEGATVASASLDAGRRKPHHLPEWLCRAAIKAGYKVSELMNDRFSGSVRKVEVMWFGQGIDDSWARKNNLLPTPRVREVLRTAHTALGKKKDRRFANS